MGQDRKQENDSPFGMLLQLFAMGADVRFIDGKDEFSAFSGFYPSEKIASDVEAVQSQLNDVLAIVSERQKIMSEETQNVRKSVSRLLTSVYDQLRL